MTRFEMGVSEVFLDRSKVKNQKVFYVGICLWVHVWPKRPKSEKMQKWKGKAPNFGVWGPVVVVLRMGGGWFGELKVLACDR